MLTTQEHMDLEKLQGFFGEMSIDEILTLAIEAEENVKVMRDGDIAKQRFQKEAAYLLRYAELLEKDANSEPKKVEDVAVV